MMKKKLNEDMSTKFGKDTTPMGTDTSFGKSTDMSGAMGKFGKDKFGKGGAIPEPKMGPEADKVEVTISYALSKDMLDAIRKKLSGMGMETDGMDDNILVRRALMSILDRFIDVDNFNPDDIESAGAGDSPTEASTDGDAVEFGDTDEAVPELPDFAAFTESYKRKGLEFLPSFEKFLENYEMENTTESEEDDEDIFYVDDVDMNDEMSEEVDALEDSFEEDEDIMEEDEFEKIVNDPNFNVDDYIDDEAINKYSSPEPIEEDMDETEDMDDLDDFSEEDSDDDDNWNDINFEEDSKDSDDEWMNDFEDEEVQKNDLPNVDRETAIQNFEEEEDDFSDFE